MWNKFVRRTEEPNNSFSTNQSIDLSDLNETIEVIMEQQITDLAAKIQELTLQLNSIQPAVKVEEYQDVNVAVASINDISLHIYRTLPEFNGQREEYATWRTLVSTTMKLLENHHTTLRYFEAFMIIRNKITGPASNVLNNYNTAFNFEAIIDRLDFTYADKRPLHILEHELLILQQAKLSVDEFYDNVNEKLNAIINKINMTHKEKATSRAFIDTANEKALRTFITGLNHKRGELLYASNPKSLPEAYARLQTISNDQERIYYASRHHYEERERIHTPNPHFKYREFQPVHPNDEPKPNIQDAPMEIDKSSTNASVGKKSLENQGRFDCDSKQNQRRFNYDSKQNQRQFDYDNQKRFDPVYKRDRSNTNIHSNSEQKQKIQRFNNITDEKSNAKTILHNEPIGELSDDEFNDTSSMVLTERSSFFLGE